tara:strand:+ start:51 stop:1118 length:1068 start_codon:yes stop_codon:yes gene_type:complete
MNNYHIQQLDVFRALAALSVCAVHFNYNSFFHNHFAEGLFVQLFFTLSGFVITLNYLEKINILKDFKAFFFKRFKRLYPLHLFFLLIFLAIELIRYFLVLKYNVQVNNVPFEINNLKNFLLNLFFIQHFADTYNFNSPSWSISVEIMLYITLGLLILINKKIFFYFSLTYVLTFLFFFNNLYGATLSINAYFSGLYSFLVGCLFCFLFLKKRIELKNTLLNFLYYILITIFIIEIFYFKSIDQKYFYSILFGLVFYFSCYLDRKFFLFNIFFNKYFIFLGKISYSIYLSHLFIFFVLNNFLKYIFKYPTKVNENNINVLDLTYFSANLYTILAYLITIVFSYLTYQYIEMRFYKK